MPTFIERLEAYERDELKRLTRERDELAAALQVLMHDADSRGYKLSEYAIHAARAALAKLDKGV